VSMETHLLSVIAGATAIMAVVQVGLVVGAICVALRINRLLQVIEGEVRPTLGRVNAASADAARAASLAVTQAERVEQLFERLAAGADEVSVEVRKLVVDPVRWGGAVLIALQSALLAYRHALARESPEGTASQPGEQASNDSAAPAG